MKRWFRQTIICGALVCLLLGLSQPISLNHPWQVIGAGPWFDRGEETTFDLPTASVVTSMAFDPVCAGPRESSVLDCALTADHLGPPGHETHGPPGTDRALTSCRSSRHSNQRPSSNLSPRNQRLSTVELKNRAFATAFS